jgi:hypothetical protein
VRRRRMAAERFRRGRVRTPSTETADIPA